MVSTGMDFHPRQSKVLRGHQMLTTADFHCRINDLKLIWVPEESTQEKVSQRERVRHLVPSHLSRRYRPSTERQTHSRP